MKNQALDLVSWLDHHQYLSLPMVAMMILEARWVMIGFAVYRTYIFQCGDILIFPKCWKMIVRFAGK